MTLIEYKEYKFISRFRSPAHNNLYIYNTYKGIYVLAVNTP